MSSKKGTVVSIIGRPNVGKSSLFNRLVRRQGKAITHDVPGVTRDRHYAIARFDDVPDLDEAEVVLVDTGGFYPDKLPTKDDRTPNDNANIFFNIMTEHAHLAIEESDLVLLVVDCREGLLPFDESIIDYIRSAKKDFWLVINKYDSDAQAGEEADFYSLGLAPEEMFLISAAHSRGIETLRERLHKTCLKFEKAIDASDLQLGVTPREKVVGRLALIGAPNAGKSTLLNQFLKAKRALVSDIPGTTVDPIEGFFDVYFGEDAAGLDEKIEFRKKIDGKELLISEYEDFRKNNPHFFDDNAKEEELSEELCEKKSDDEVYADVFEASDESLEELEAIEPEEEEKIQGSLWRSLHIVDTAGIRKQRQIKGDIESQSVFRSLRCITESDIVLFMVDATKGIGHQDRRLIDIAIEKGKSVILCLNKIDLLKEKLQTPQDRKEWLDDLRYDIPWLNYCDLVPISAKHKKGLRRLKEIIKKTVLIRNTYVPTGQLNRVVKELIEVKPVLVDRARGGKFLKVKYASMVSNNPPTFILFSNRSKGVPENYKRYLKNNLRKHFQLDNTPIHLILRTGTDLEKRMSRVKGDATPTNS